MTRSRVIAIGIALLWAATMYSLCAARLPQLEAMRNPCEEDEALIWTDAPHTAECVALDDIR